MAVRRLLDGKSAFWGRAIGRNPTDRGKAGSKKSILVDAAGGPLSVVVAGANVHATKLLRPTLESIVVDRPEGVQNLCLGKAYAAETGFLIGTDPDHVRAPDAAFVRQERVEAAGEVQGYFPGAPDLAVEVISPNDRFADVEEKVADWLAAGATMVVLVNPRNRTATLRLPGQSPVILTEQDTLDGGEVVPGWQVAV